MAFELYGMLAGSVSPMTGEHVKPAYGGDDEAFLQKVVTPIYQTIAKVTCFSYSSRGDLFFLSFPSIYLLFYFFNLDLCALQEAKRSRGGKSKHSVWRNYDDLNEYFW